MEWVKVLYPQTRDVFVDGRRTQQTEFKFSVARGRHRFDLGEPQGYLPPHQDVTVKDTSPLDPMIIQFRRGTKAPT